MKLHSNFKKKHVKRKFPTKVKDEKIDLSDGIFTETLILSFQTNTKSQTKNTSVKKNVYEYGNYRGYYGYRGKDCRIEFMKEDWFRTRNCLDIGCNDGTVAIDIAKRYGPNMIVGIDLDKYLINVGTRMLKSLRANCGKPDPRIFPISFVLVYGPLRNYFPYNVALNEENILDQHAEDGKQYETVLCLSTTKWIHLNWGDDGIRTLFKKVDQVLTPGGYFILEPQSWASYQKKKSLTERTKQNYYQIKFKPEEFGDYLKATYGFELIDTVFPFDKDSEESSSGFNRPIYVFQKPLTSQK